MFGKKSGNMKIVSDSELYEMPINEYLTYCQQVAEQTGIFSTCPFNGDLYVLQMIWTRRYYMIKTGMYDGK